MHIKKGRKFSDYVSDFGDIAEKAYEDNECAEDYLKDVPFEVEVEFKKMLDGFADKHNLQPNFFTLGKQVYKQKYKLKGTK